MIIHPEEDSDDYPYYEDTVTESSWHYKAIELIHTVLQERFSDREDIFIGANNFVYWQKGSKNQKLSPDVYVCLGARNIDRRSYKVWEEGGIAPQVVFEITSKSSQFTDIGTKKAVYEAWGVEEYYLFDPLREYIPKGFKAFVQKRGLLQPLSGKRIFSARLGLDLRAEGRLLRFFQPGSSQRLLTYRESQLARVEAEAARTEAEAARQFEQSARRAAEAAKQESEDLVARLRAELAQLRREMEPES